MYIVQFNGTVRDEDGKRHVKNIVEMFDTEKPGYYVVKRWSLAEHPKRFGEKKCEYYYPTTGFCDFDTITKNVTVGTVHHYSADVKELFEQCCKYEGFHESDPKYAVRLPKNFLEDGMTLNEFFGCDENGKDIWVKTTPENSDQDANKLFERVTQ